jgi:hypothetical protein
MLSLQQAATETGKSKSTIFRAIRNGRLSAARTESGNFQIDPAELYRAFPVVPVAQPGNMPAERADTGLEIENRFLRERVTDLERERDRWHEAHASLLRALPAPAPRRVWWWRR